MSMISDNSPVMEKTKELCQLIVEDAEYKTLIGTVEAFLNNDEARLLYQTVHERSEELRQKQHSGVELGETEIAAFKDVRTEMEKNTLVMDFMGAQDELQLMQSAISRYVGMSLELGRVPTDEDIAASESGCCGGGCGDESGGGGG